jgi:hypothetical protein
MNQEDITNYIDEQIKMLCDKNRSACLLDLEELIRGSINDRTSELYRKIEAIEKDGRNRDALIKKFVDCNNSMKNDIKELVTIFKDVKSSGKIARFIFKGIIQLSALLGALSAIYFFIKVFIKNSIK